MKKCLVSLEEDRALAYLDGTLPEAEAEEFEAHYFQCPECLARVQTLEAMEVVLGRLPAAEPAALRRRVVLGWPALVWALGAAAGVLVLSVISVQRFELWMTPAWSCGERTFDGSLNVIHGWPVSNSASIIFFHSASALSHAVSRCCPC